MRKGKKGEKGRRVNERRKLKLIVLNPTQMAFHVQIKLGGLLFS